MRAAAVIEVETGNQSFRTMGYWIDRNAAGEFCLN
jgi:hypothetical protein